MWAAGIAKQAQAVLANQPHRAASTAVPFALCSGHSLQHGLLQPCACSARLPAPGPDHAAPCCSLLPQALSALRGRLDREVRPITELMSTLAQVPAPFFGALQQWQHNMKVGHTCPRPHGAAVLLLRC